jgi:hypothetical protein
MYHLRNSGNMNAARRILLVTLAAVAVWFALPGFLQFSSTVTSAETEFMPGLTANLTGDPIGNVTPHGFSNYFESSMSRSLTVQASMVNLPAGTSLNVFLNADSIGTFTLDMYQRGGLFLSTDHGGTVPNVVAGDTLSIKDGDTTILSGVFAARMTPSPTATHTASPSPTGSPIPFAHFYAPLTGDPIGGITPRGLGSYHSGGMMQRSLDVWVADVNLPEGESLSVSIGAAMAPDDLIGTITLHDHAGVLHLSTFHGDTVPEVVSGTPITVSDNGTAVLAGVFTDTMPTPSPSQTPTSTPTPGPAHAFAAMLSGANEVPPVMTRGRGAGNIFLNAADTSIRVSVGFAHLSSAVTAVTINGPAMPNENGPVIFTLAPPPGPLMYTYQTFVVTAEQVDQLRMGLWYFQVATVDHPDGEIRGQIRPMTRHAMDGDGPSNGNTMFQQVGGNWYVSLPDQSVDVYRLALPAD